MKKYALSEGYKALSREEAEALLKDSANEVDTSVSNTSDEPLDNSDR